MGSGAVSISYCLTNIDPRPGTGVDHSSVYDFVIFGLLGCAGSLGYEDIPNGNNFF